MTVPPRLSVITLGARNVAQLADFYEALGWKTHRADDDFARFETGGAVLTLSSMPLLAEEAGGHTLPAGDAFSGFTLAINVERAEQVDQAIEEAQAAGARVLAPPVTRDWGGRSGYFADPEGNVWEVAWVPGAAFDERGSLIWPERQT